MECPLSNCLYNINGICIYNNGATIIHKKKKQVLIRTTSIYDKIILAKWRWTSLRGYSFRRSLLSFVVVSWLGSCRRTPGVVRVWDSCNEEQVLILYGLLINGDITDSLKWWLWWWMMISVVVTAGVENQGCCHTILQEGCSWARSKETRRDCLQSTSSTYPPVESCSGYIVKEVNVAISQDSRCCFVALRTC